LSQNRRDSEPSGRNVRDSEPSGRERVSDRREKGAISCVRGDKRRTKRRRAQQLCGFGSTTVRFGSKTDIVGEVIFRVVPARKSGRVVSVVTGAI